MSVETDPAELVVAFAEGWDAWLASGQDATTISDLATGINEAYPGHVTADSVLALAYVVGMLDAGHGLNDVMLLASKLAAMILAGEIS